MDAVGNGLTVMMAEPDWFWLQIVLLASVTLIKLYVNVPGVAVGTDTVILFPVVVTTV